jgi:hypothetical protein
MPVSTNADAIQFGQFKIDPLEHFIAIGNIPAPSGLPPLLDRIGVVGQARPEQPIALIQQPERLYDILANR